MTDIIFKNGKVSDYNLSIQLNHSNVDETTTLINHNEYKLILSGALTIQDNETGYYYSGEDIVDFITKELNQDLNEFFEWLEKNSEHEFFDNRLTVDSNPWLEWIDEDGECIGDVFDEFYEEKSENINMLKETILK